MSRALLLLFLASHPASALQLPAGVSSTARTQDLESWPLRLVDATGRPLPAGTQVELRTEWHLLDQPADGAFLVGINDEPFVKQLVGPDGQLTWAKRSGPPHYRGYLHARLVEPAETRSRAFVPWPAKVSSGSPIELKLEPEQVLCSGRIVDERGKPVMLDSVFVRISDPRGQSWLDPMHLLDAQVKPSEGGYVISGWPQGGPWQISAKYIYHGPESLPRAMDFGQHAVDLILPVTGHVQTRAKLPDPFPRGALEAVYQHVSSGEVLRRPVFDQTTNHRLRAGAQRMRIELGGESILDLGEVEVPGDGQLDVDLPLPPSLRVLRISVFEADGKPIKAVQARIQGGDEKFRFNNEAPLGAILVATTRESLDLTIESQGFEPVQLGGVDGDRRVELHRSRR